MAIALQPYVNTAADTAVQMSVAATFGYICSRLFTTTNPLNGAVFCAVSTLVTKVVTPFFEEFFAGRGANEASKMIGLVISIGIGIGASAFVSTAIGFPITFSTGLVLTCTIVAMAALGAFALSATGLRI